MASARVNLYNLGFQTVKDLETEQGILASGRNEVYACIFGRDSLITSLKLLQVYKKAKNEDCLRIVKKSLTTLATLQGKDVNIESGEEPGKCIHEYRPEKHEHLTEHLSTPWYLYPDNVMRNYDTVDATPLFLITLYRYYQASKDDAFVEQLLPNIKAAINWLFMYADSNGDGFVDYALHKDRKHGGLTNQNWMDSVEATFHENGRPVVYPLAPIEAQAYSYFAMRLWQIYFVDPDRQFAEILAIKAQELKELFNEKFVIQDKKGAYLASYVDGNGTPLASVRSNMGHVLWASLNKTEDGVVDGILAKHYISAVVKRLMASDMFERKAGIRTLSKNSRNFSPNSYHNGSIWPHDNSIIAEGLEHFGYKAEALKVRNAYLRAIAYFNTPIELFVYWNGEYSEYADRTGQTSCHQQAWSAASILADTISMQAKPGVLLDKLFGASLLLMLFNEVKMERFNSIIEKSVIKFTNSVPMKKITLPKKFKLIAIKENPT